MSIDLLAVGAWPRSLEDLLLLLATGAFILVCVAVRLACRRRWLAAASGLVAALGLVGLIVRMAGRGITAAEIFRVPQVLVAIALAVAAAAAFWRQRLRSGRAIEPESAREPFEESSGNSKG